VFYASEQPRTAAVEMAFYRLLFFAESPRTPWPANPGEYTAFAAEYAAGRAIDLRAPPFDATPDVWTHPTDYEACQSIAEACREEGIDAIKYRSARDPVVSTNVAILHCRAFAVSDAVERQTWRIQVGGNGARIFCEFPKVAFEYGREVFAGDARIRGMVWERR
jgi:hypothetical protein